MEFRFASLLPLCFSLLFFNRCHGGSVLQMSTDSSSLGFDPTRVSQLSWSPRAFIYKGFLTENESDHLIKQARDKLEQSMVADSETGKSIPSEVRTSSGMFFSKAQDEIVSRIEQRIAAWTFLPIENGEAIQVLRYELGQKYEPHFDYFHDKNNLRYGGHRIATVLMYLTNVEKGGETVFPYALGVEQPKNDSWSDCAKKGYAVKPSKGDALLFFSLHLDATTDERSLHGSCPVIEGEKWSATKWIHVRPFKKPSENCVDYSPNCPGWANSGECEKNPLYMIGNNVMKGFCRQSCDMGRPPCCDKANVKRGLWTPEEDAKILAYVANHGTGNWTLVPKKAGLNRCGKSCRLRWTNYLRPDLKHEGFSPQEEDLIVELHRAIGSRWSLIAKRLPGRTDNDVKNYWNTKLKKKLMKMGIDPITHKPFSQIFSDYNNVSFLTNHAPQSRSASTVLNPSFVYQAQPQQILSQAPMVPIFSQFHDQSVEIQAGVSSGVMNIGLFDELSPASSCSSSSSSMTDARQRAEQSLSVFNGDVQAEHAALQCDIFEGSQNDQKKVGETSSFVKAILDRDTELQLDLLSLNEFLDY